MANNRRESGQGSARGYPGAKSYSLVRPAPRVCDRPQRPLADRLDAIDRFQEQHPLLQVRREQQQVEEMGQPRAREAESPRDVGLVAQLAVRDRLLDLVRERQHQGHARGPLHGRRRRLRREALPMPTLDAVKRAGEDLRGGGHAMASSWVNSLVAAGTSSAVEMSVMWTLTLFAGSSTSTRWTTARKRRARFSGVSTSQTLSKSARHSPTQVASTSSASRLAS